MSVVGETFVALRVISGNLEKDIAAHVQAAVKKAEGVAQVTPKVNNPKTKTELGKMESIFKASFDQIRSKIHTVAEEGGPFSSTLAKIAEKATAIGPAGTAAAIGIAAVTAEAVAATHTFIEFAEQVHKFQLLSGASTEDASRFVVALRLLGVDADRVGAGLFRLSRNAGGANNQLKQLGVQTAYTAQGGVDLVGTFLNIADAVKQAGGGSQSAQVAFAAFGRSGLALLPILARGRDGLQALFAEADKNHEILHEGDVETAIRLKIELNNLRERLHALQVDAGKHSAGFLSKAVGFAETEERGAVRFFHGLNVAVHSAGDTLVRGAEILGGHAEATRKDGHAARETAEDIQVLAQKYQAEQQAADSALGAIQAELNAKHGYDAATRAVSDAVYAEGEAQDRLNQLRRQGAVDERQVASAQEQYENSTRSLERAQQDLAKAEQHVEDVRKGATPLELESAQLRVRQSTVALSRAEQDLADMQRHHHRNALDLAEAQNAVEAAQIEQQQAQDDLNDTQTKGTEGSSDLTQALDDLKTAQDNVQQATRDQKNAADDLRRAQAGDPDFAHNLAAAERDVAAAKQQVNDANDARANAAINLFNATATETDAINNLGGAYGALRNELQLIAGMYGIDLSQFLNKVGGAPQDSRVTTGDAQGQYDKKGRLIKMEPNGGRAVGGPTNAGYWYQINEEGQEFFKSNASGTVYPVGQTPPGAGNLAVEQNFHLYGSNPQETAFLTSVYSGRALRTLSR